MAQSEKTQRFRWDGFVNLLHRGFASPIRSFLLVSLTLNALCSAVVFWRGSIKHLNYPYNRPLVPFEHFIDFTCFITRFRYLHTEKFFWDGSAFGTYFQYPAPAAFIYGLFYSIRRPTLTFCVFSALLVLAALTLFARALARSGVQAWRIATILCLSVIGFEPVYFQASQGNIEIIIVAVLAAGVLFYRKESNYIAAVLFGMAAGFKLFPGIFLALFLSKKKFRPIFVGVAAALVLNLAALRYLSPSIPLSNRGIQEGLTRARTNIFLRFAPVNGAYDHSVFALCKRVLHSHLGNDLPSKYLTFYMVVVALTGLTFYIFRLRFLPELNQITSFYVAAVLLPPASFDYTLLHLTVPLGLLTLYYIELKKRMEKTSSGLQSAFVCFAVALSFEGEVIFHGGGLGGQVKCIALFALLIVSASRPWSCTHVSATVPDPHRVR